jgi:restriction endonuclease S subunit
MKAQVTKKYSGIEAIGDIPFHWKIEPLKYNVGINRTSLNDSTPKDTLISYVDIESVLQDGTVKDPEILTFGDAPSRARRVIGPNDTIISMVRTYLESIAYFPNPPANLICSTGFAVLTPYSKITPKFLYYWIRSNFFINEVVARSVGVSYPALNSSEIGRLLCLLPPLEEQNSIVQLLDIKIKQIADHIYKRHKLIELLKEIHQSLIVQSVTKGLDPNVSLTDSGIKWIGNIPEHWEIKRVKYVCIIKYGSNLKDDDRVVGDIDVYGSNGVVGSHNLPLTKSNTIIIGRKGSIGELNYSMKSCFPIDTTYYVDKTLTKNHLKWLFYCFTCLKLDERNQDSAVPGLSRTDVYSLRIPVPTYEKQQKLSNFLDEKVNKISTNIKMINKQIERLQEYKRSLISAAVTGKLDIREEIAVQ